MDLLGDYESSEHASIAGLRSEMLFLSDQEHSRGVDLFLLTGRGLKLIIHWVTYTSRLKYPQPRRLNPDSIKYQPTFLVYIRIAEVVPLKGSLLHLHATVLNEYSPF